MRISDESILDGQFVDSYDLTLTGVADDIVREELRRCSHYETSDGLIYRISQQDLRRMRLALAERFGEDQLHPEGAMWTERQVYAGIPMGEPSDQGTVEDAWVL